ncbi:hypothetical protein ESN35_03215 [Bifidobacterium pullorum subsp. gallinarum]|uniref:Head fiber protein n=1 Tax=Bifidobacterium pullorum subsp. gallinarum TaxID=78344 RepID=A0A4P6DSY0_9BIFI|nr:hypothetical protein [Bifidobacterium pullorum]QAY32545.1 hypothetical protein ESN35_03215 [Bifidobacterium pullorum subsp. gallinarum]
MPAPVYATLGNADRDESQEAIDLNIVDSSGKHVDLGGGQAEPGDGSITAAKLAASAVETEKIKDAAVTEAKIADAAVTGEKIADGAVTDDKIAAGTINADKLAPGVIPTAATTSVTGLVKQAAHVADPAGEAPTKAEFIALRDALVAAGQMAAA